MQRKNTSDPHPPKSKKALQFCHLHQIPTKRQNSDQETNARATTPTHHMALDPAPHARPGSVIAKSQSQIVPPPLHLLRKASSRLLLHHHHVPTLLVTVYRPQPSFHTRNSENRMALCGFGSNRAVRLGEVLFSPSWYEAHNTGTDTGLFPGWK